MGLKGRFNHFKCLIDFNCTIFLEQFNLNIREELLKCDIYKPSK